MMNVERLPVRLVKPDRSIRSTEPLLPASCRRSIALSLSDVAIPPFIHTSKCYAYEAAAAPRTCDLETALQKVLCEYDEFAGEYGQDAAGQPCIYLHDKGVGFIQAKTDVSLHSLWPFQPDLSMLAILPPPSDEQLLCIQVTTFACGGVFLGIRCNHQVADGEGLCQFMEAWAAIVRGEAIACAPCHDRSVLMGDRAWELVPYFKGLGLVKEPEGLVRKRLSLDAHRIKEIKALAASEGAADAGVIYSTFVSVLSHVWKCIMIAQGFDNEDEEEEGESMLTLSVNLRMKLSPPLPKGYFGNAICHVRPQVKIKDLVSQPISFLTGHLHGAIEEVRTKAATSLTPLDVIQPLIKEQPQLTARVTKSTTCLAQHLFVTSWLTQPLYDLDFGGGIPLFAGNPFVLFNGIVTFTKQPNCGMALDLALHASYMERFECML